MVQCKKCIIYEICHEPGCGLNPDRCVHYNPIEEAEG